MAITLKPTKNWRDQLTIAFFIIFIVLSYYLYVNIETLKTNPCKLCVEKYDFDCYNYQEGWHINSQILEQGMEQTEVQYVNVGYLPPPQFITTIETTNESVS